MRRTLRRLIAGIVLSLALCHAASASILDTPEFRAMRDSGFAAGPVLAFADLAERSGDPDAAIAALERLSARQAGSDPDAGSVHARLARLYAAAGNAEMAAMHAEAAASAAAKAQASAAPAAAPPQTVVTGRLTAGMAYDSNPTAVPAAGTVPVFDAASRSFVRVPSGQAEGDALATLRLDGSLVSRLSESALLAVELSVLTEKYVEQETLDSVTIVTTAGPWLTLDDSRTRWLRPYLAMGAGTLDGQPYYGSLGAGLALRQALWQAPEGTRGGTAGLSVILDLTYTDYAGGISNVFDADTQDNLALRLGGGIDGTLGIGIDYALYAYTRLTQAAARSERYASVGLYGSARVPLGDGAGRPLALRLAGSVAYDTYRAVDVAVDPVHRRRDLWLEAEAGLGIALSDTVELTLGAEFLRQLSTVAIYDTRNIRGFARIGYAF